MSCLNDKRPLRTPNDPAYIESLTFHTEKWQKLMAATGYTFLQPDWVEEFRSYHVKMKWGPIGITLHGPVQLEMWHWVPREVLEAWQTRDESAHTRAAWEAILINPKFVGPD